MTLGNPEHPLPLNLVATKDLVEELQNRFDVFVASGIKVRRASDLCFQFGVRGHSFDVISMLEFLKAELILRSLEESHGNGNGLKDFD